MIASIMVLFVSFVYVCWQLSRERRKHYEYKSKCRQLDFDLQHLKNVMEAERWREVSSSYIVTDSDLVRFKTPKDIYFNARKRIATNIGFDIVKHFQPEESLTETGKTKYTYTFKIRK